MTNILSCFFPTTIVLVDDSPSFLNALTSAIDIKNITFKQFSSPHKALEYINDVNRINNLDCSDLMRYGENSASDRKSMMLNINHLHRAIYSYDRFAKISVVITDYAMPGFNGVELCQRIEDKNIRKIILTGADEEKTAIKAFNSGYINKFVKKGTDNFEEEITTELKKSIQLYFDSHTGDVSRYLSNYDKAHLSDPVFANFFFNICSSRNYVEYYMLDIFGSYLFLNAQGKPSLLSVLTDHEIEKIIDIGVESMEISSGILEALRSREYMLVSHNRTGQLPPINEWDKHIYPSRRLDAYQVYYFSLPDPYHLDLDFENIKSFDDFQKT